ncbi:hypothetical protein FE257_006916 [Aspergillus nanangensis]|uniref:GA4 desaturase family protein n=1 Tax=Aspergillus nanangensis TaxID=2582783 RepID=A0AAD4GUK9_ASPNN|nr:hypothetical protein FE257_006916 [Aspergillus nanangensis]
MPSNSTTMLTEPANMVRTKLNYFLDPELGGHVDIIPGTAGFYRCNHDTHSVDIHDIKDREEEFNLNKQGFQIYLHDSAEKEFRDDEQIKAVYYPETEAWLKKVTGATTVKVCTHLVRRDPREALDATIANSDLEDTATIPKVVPARFVHVDHSRKGAIGFLHENYPPDEAARLMKTRWSIINVWRPLKTVRRDPLAVCDSRSVQNEELIPMTVRLPPKGSATYENVSRGDFETLSTKVNPAHRWYFKSGMEPGEPLLIKIYDSRSERDGGLAGRVLHTSFTVPGTEDEEPRESIEVRCFVFYEDEAE